MPFNYDLIVKGRAVLDPSQDLRSRRDVAFRNAKVEAVAGNIPRQEGAQVIDVGGRLVVPGLIDFHGHYAYKISLYRAPDTGTPDVPVARAEM